jgi:hypothetical protein
VIRWGAAPPIALRNVLNTRTYDLIFFISYQCCPKENTLQVTIDSCKWCKFHVILIGGICCVYKNHITKNTIVFPT